MHISLLIHFAFSSMKRNMRLTWLRIFSMLSTTITKFAPFIKFLNLFADRFPSFVLHSECPYQSRHADVQYKLTYRTNPPASSPVILATLFHTEPSGREACRAAHDAIPTYNEVAKTSGDNRKNKTRDAWGCRPSRRHMAVLWNSQTLPKARRVSC